jgi:hypothetical protein
MGIVRTWQRWYFPRLAEYVALLDRHGFEVRLAQTFVRPVALPDRDGRSGLSLWLETFISDVLNDLGSRREEFLQRVQAHAAPALFGEDGWRLVDYRRLRVFAVRCQPGAR